MFSSEVVANHGYIVFDTLYSADYELDFGRPAAVVTRGHSGDLCVNAWMESLPWSGLGRSGRVETEPATIERPTSRP